MITKDNIIQIMKNTAIGKKFIKYNNGTKILWFTIGLISGFVIGYSINNILFYNNGSKQM